jgi:flavorubredoxin
MNALVVYDTKTGMTEKIAMAIATGIKDSGMEVSTKRAEEVSEEDFRNAEVWVIGAPTHVGGPTGPAKRALKSAIKAGASGKKGTAFDTRFANINKGATDKLSKLMKEAGMQMVVEPQWFVVTGMKGPLADGEEAKAKEFGAKIASASR